MNKCVTVRLPMKKTILITICSLLLLAGCSGPSTLDEFTALVIDDSKNAEYKVDQRPIGYQNVMLNGKVFAKEFEAEKKTVFVHAKEDWNSREPKEKQDFYLEVSSQSDCFGQATCADPIVRTWYGPFKGPLGSWVK